jgi:oligopeptide transport system substrate-binding protein
MRKSLLLSIAALSLVAASCGGGSGKTDSTTGGETSIAGGSTESSTAESSTAESSVAESSVAEPGGTGTAPATEASGGTSAGPKKLTDGRVLAAGNPPHLDPAQNFTLEGAELEGVLWDGLAAFDWADPKNAKLVPAAAESWTGNADSTEFVFKVRKHNFSNGNPVLPSSFAYAWNRASDPKLAATYAYLFFNVVGGKERVEGKAPNITGIVADDAAMTLTVKLVRPFADFPTITTHNVFFPVDEVTVSKVADQSKYEQQVMIGNGPFVMAGAYVPDKGLTVTKNPTYWGTPAGLDEIKFVVSKEIDTAYSSFEAGQVDTSAIPSGKFKSATGKYPFVQAPAFTVDYYVFNAEDPVVGGEKNEKLRQAISLAIDTTVLADAVCQGSCIPAKSITPTGIPGQSNLCTICNRDVEKSKKLLEEWKAAGNTLTPIEISFNSGAGHEDTINLVQAQLQEVGIEVKQAPISSDTYFQTMGKTPAQFFRLGWAADYPLQDNFLYDLFASDSANNYGRFKSKEFDDLITKARGTSDAVARAAIYNEAEALVVNTGNAIPFNWGNGGFVFAKNVQNAKRFPNGFANYREMTVG